MADYGYVSSSSSSPTNKLKKSCSSIFTSPWLFSNFSSKGLSDTDSPLMSPTSILDNTKPFPALKTPFWPNAPNTPKSDNKNSRGVGLGLIDALNDEICDPKLSKPESGMVLFGSKLNIQIPPLVSAVISSGATDSPMSPGDFGIKTRVLSPTKKSPFGSLNSPRFFSGEMELLEEYTCVITRGPNPKTTHIFDDCIVDSCCGVVENSLLKKGNGFVSHDESLSYPSMSFLSSCYHCKKNLGKGNDIYMYRGERAFCSSECRYKEIMSDEGKEKCDDIDGI